MKNRRKNQQKTDAVKNYKKLKISTANLFVNFCKKKST